ncbi:hypothetical protein Trydic_g5243 [Trypoxylus dichotomus]
MEMDNLTYDSFEILQNITLEELLGPRRDNLYIVIPMTVIYMIILLTGLIGNVSTCVVIARNKSMHTATNYYLFNLAISDLLLLLTGLPPEMYSIWSRYPDIFGYTFCVIRGLFSETCANATVLTITAFTVERYVAICHPFLSQTLAKLSRIIKLILIIWIVSICFAIPQALQLEIVRSVDGVPESDTCMAINAVIEHSFELSTFMFFVAPMTLITVLYVMIGIRLRKSTTMLRKEGAESNRHLGTKEMCPNRNVSGRHQGNQSSRRVLKMLVAVVVAFFICWAPFHAQRLIATYVKAPADGNTNDSIPLKIYEISTYISGILYYVSTTINPLLYNIMSNKFREAFKETFARCCLVPKRRHKGPLQRSYSVLSRSTQRRPESSDSGRDDPSQHTHTILIRRNSCDGNAQLTNDGRRSLTKKSPQKSGSIDSDREAVTFTWIANRSDVEVTMTSKMDFENIQPGTKLVAVRVNSVPPTRLNKFLRFFRCIAKKTLLDENRRLSSYYTSSISPTNKGNKSTIELESSPNKLDNNSLTSGEISNSSLRNVDHALLKDELGIYISTSFK